MAADLYLAWDGARGGTHAKGSTRMEPNGVEPDIGGDDTLPEHATYRDEGCGNGCARSLDCPFPRCRFDDPVLWQRLERQRRDREVLAARSTLGLSVEDLVQRFAISKRTVHRILATGHGGRNARASR